MAQYTEEHLKQFYTKKYLALIHRLEENHNDKYRKYERESIRLKKKYQNILTKLTHEQLMEFKKI